MRPFSERFWTFPVVSKRIRVSAFSEGNEVFRKNTSLTRRPPAPESICGEVWSLNFSQDHFGGVGPQNLPTQADTQACDIFTIVC